MKTLIINLMLLVSGLTGEATYVPPPRLTAVSYPAHVELTWANDKGFDYEIWLDCGDGFVKRGTTDKAYYMDFVTAEGSDFLTYRVVPAGADVAVATDCEVKTSFERNCSDDSLLDMVERYTLRYFHEFGHPVYGLARERSNNDIDMITTGGTGFGIMALVAAAERGYYTREAVLDDVTRMVAFLESAERFHGAWAHWYDGATGRPFSFSRYDDGGDLVETAFLIQGLLTARSYFDGDNEAEQTLCKRITALWEGVEWNWYTRGEKDALYWHWSKNHGWKMDHRIKGFDETLITYILAASSPTYPIDPEIYHKCYTNSTYFFNGKSYYGIPLSLGMEYGGPLFFTHYSFLGLDPRGLHDRYADYFERNRAHALIHRAYAIDNPKGHKDFGAKLWGFTSSDDALVGYTSHHPGTDAENGTVTPSAALSSIPYTPEYSMEVLKYLYFECGSKVFGPYGFYDAYNPSLVEGQQVVHSYLAIDQGPIAVMIENYRSGLIWRLFMQNDEIRSGLEKLGFHYSE